MNWRRHLISSVLIFLFGATFQYYVFCSECIDSFERITNELAFSGILWVALWKGSEFWVDLLDRYSVSWIKAPIQRLIYSVLTVVIYVIFIYYLIYLVLAVFVLGHDIGSAFGSVSYRDYLMPLIITLGINVIMHGRGFLLNLRQESIDNERLKTEQVASQLTSLKDQVNPHFLFNSLNALSSLVYDDQKKAVKFIRKLSDVYRYVLDQTDKELATVTEELQFIESYRFLLQIRFDDNFSLDTSGIDQSSKNKMIPPMSLQLLVENCIKHNVVSGSKPLQIEIFTQSGNFLVIKNNVNPKKSMHSKGIGLTNLKMRYQFLSDKRMIINHTEKHFEVFLPLLELKD